MLARSRRRWDPGPVRRAALESVAAMGQEIVVVGADARRVPVGDRSAPGVVDPVVVNLQVAGGAAPGPHAGVAVALEDGGAQQGGDVASVVGDAGDVAALVGHNLDEGPGQDGPD